MDGYINNKVLVKLSRFDCKIYILQLENSLAKFQNSKLNIKSSNKKKERHKGPNDARKSIKQFSYFYDLQFKFMNGLFYIHIKVNTPILTPNILIDLWLT